MNDLAANSRVLLLVDDEPNIVNALKRTFRRDGYTLLTANSGTEGLDILAQQEAHVILSDQRMPQMTGVEFLRNVKHRYPKTIRIALSGYTDLESITSAINEGAIYKFLTKPWDDEQLRENIRKSFEHYEMAQENRRLTEDLKQANEALSLLNKNLEQKVLEKTSELILNAQILQISQEILQNLPLAVIGIDELGMIAFANRSADELFGDGLPKTLLGDDIAQYLPTLLLNAPDSELVSMTFEADALGLKKSGMVQITVSPMGLSSCSEGKILCLYTLPNGATG